MKNLVHIVEHYFKKVCICPCDLCTIHVRTKIGNAPVLDLVKCICPGCDREMCGARNGV